MKIIKPTYLILNKEDLLEATKQIEKAARTCYQSEGKITDDSHIKLVEKLIAGGHDAMLEFGPSITVVFVCDRGVSHELVRHRVASFAQESTRYCNYSKDAFENNVTFIQPFWISDEQIDQVERSFAYAEEPTKLWFNTMHTAEQSYLLLIKKGWTPQQARSVLPNSLKTEIVVKANIREWLHIFKLRTSPKAHPQMRELMVLLLKEFSDVCPTIFKVEHNA